MIDIVVFWVSRHALLRAQEKELRRLLGTFRLVPIVGRIPSAEYIAKLVVKAKEKRKIVIPVLPLTMIKKLALYGRKYGFEVWWSEMVTVAKGNDSQPPPMIDPEKQIILPTRGGWKVKEFRGFKKVIDVVILAEDVSKK